MRSVILTDNTFFPFYLGVYHVHYYARGRLNEENRLKFIQLHSLQQDYLHSAKHNTMNVEKNHINISQRLDDLTKHEMVNCVYINVYRLKSYLRKSLEYILSL